MVFPFSFEVNSRKARRTADNMHRLYLAGEINLRWLWTVGRLATQYFYQGRAQDGYEILKQGPSTVGPFMAPCEQFREDKGAFLAWYTVGAGAFIHAMNAMFVQVLDPDMAAILPALSPEIADARFRRLLANHGVFVSGTVENHKLRRLSAVTEKSMLWQFRIPERFVSAERFHTGVSLSEADPAGLITVRCELNAGVTELLK
jgi:hypothetical protein